MGGFLGKCAMAKILVIEDEACIQKVWIRTFKGHEVTVVSSGRQAMDALETVDGLFDIVLSDFNIEGGLTGIDVYLFAKTLSLAYIQRYVFCSANGIAEHFAQNEGVSFFQKPFPVRLLVVEVEKKLQRQKLLDETDTAPFHPIDIESLSEAVPASQASASAQ